MLMLAINQPKGYPIPQVGSEHDGIILSVVAVMFLITAMVYLIPTIIAFLRGHHAKWGIFTVNLFAGWSGFGWIACLFWAVSAVDQTNYRYNRRHD